jgi:hypothetical protein
MNYQVFCWPAGRYGRLSDPDCCLDHDWHMKAKAMTEHWDRPDPLAEPEGYGARPQDEGYDLSRCAGSGSTCERLPGYITWIGCPHEHVGPVADCEQHARQLLSSVACLVCGLCGTPVSILRTEPELPPAPQIGDLLARAFNGEPEI